MMRFRAVRFSEIDLRLRRLLGDERDVLVDFLLSLEEFDRGRGYEDLEYATLWDYCRRELGLLDCAIARRVQSMRILRRFPVAEAYLRDGRLCMTGIGMLEKALTAENHVEIFDRASRKTTREIVAIAVESNAPLPEKAVLRKLPEAAKPVASLEFSTPEQDRSCLAGGSADAIPGAALAIESADSVATGVTKTPTTTRPRQKVVQVSPRQYKITLVVGDAFKAKLDRVKKILSHSVPDGNLEALLSRALDLVLAKDDRRHAAPIPKKTARHASRPNSAIDAAGEVARKNPTEAAALNGSVNDAGEAAPAAPQVSSVDGEETRRPASAESRRREREYIPVDVRKALWARDEGKCCWELASGETCGSEFQVQPDHKIPVAFGGRSVLSNLRLLCRLHNLLAARRAFGEAFMAKFRKRG